MKLPIEVSQVRPFTESDIEQVGDLHRRGFGISGPLTPELVRKYRTYFSEVFLNNPWNPGGSAALVYEENDRTISGFLGSVIRPMLFKGERIHLRIGTQFIVDPQRRGFAGLKLLRALFAGPQELTMGDEGNSQSRGLWEAFGGSVLLLYSMHWYYPLKPWEAARRAVASFGGVPGFIPRLAVPFTRALDGVAAPVLATLTRSKASEFIEKEPSTKELASCMAEAATGKSLRPDYDERALDWVFERAKTLRPAAVLTSKLFRTDAGQMAGWYIYLAARGGAGEVLQLYANPGFEKPVLDHLIEHARAQGVAVLSGRMEPGMAQAFSDRRCIMRCGPEWVLVRSSRPDLLEALTRGDALLSKLEGEWCFRFQ
jgi:hypothetical protein